MSNQTYPKWHEMRTLESCGVEALLRKEFAQVDAYRYNSASIRVRVIDPRFEGLSDEQRDAMVEPYLNQLQEGTQADIVNLLTITPAEATGFSKRSLANMEFEDPSPSTL